MKNWKDECNFRRIKDKDGVAIANVIYIDGEAIEVTNEVYEAYAQMGRRERYLEEQMNEIPHVSLEKLMEADVPIDVYTTGRPLPLKISLSKQRTNWSVYRFYTDCPKQWRSSRMRNGKPFSKYILRECPFANMPKKKASQQ